MNKLRLLVTDECDRCCEGCCNKQIWPSGILEDLGHCLNYEMIMITGGEPLKFPHLLVELLYQMRRYADRRPIILYTAIKVEKSEFLQIMFYLDGLTFTIHDKAGWDDFIIINKWLTTNPRRLQKRVNIFRDVEIPEVPYVLSLYGWDVKFISWVDNCPIPEGETFLRLLYPFTSERL